MWEMSTWDIFKIVLIWKIYLNPCCLQGARHAFASSAGRDEANPTALLLCAANMLKHMHLEYYSNVVRRAVEMTVKAGKVSGQG